MSKFWILLIAILEIIGGIFGIAFVVLQIVAGQTGLVFASVACAVYILSFAAGVALLRNRPFGRVGSIIVQSIQLPKYGSQLFVFMFSFGFDAYLYFALTNTANAIMGFEFKFLAFNQLFVNVADAPVIFGVSIPASIFLAMLLKYKRRAGSPDPDATRTEQIVGRERNQRASHRQLGRNVVVSRRVNSNVMLLLLSGQIAAFIPGVFSFVIVALLLVALMKVDSIKQNRILYVVLVIVALFFVFAGVFLLYASEFWYVVTSSNLFSDYVAT